MKLCALLSHYDESPTMLAACIASLPKLGVDHLIAVDGGYALYPSSRGNSGVQSNIMLVSLCESLGIGLTLDMPKLDLAHHEKPSEVDKRNRLFRLAQAQFTADDWLLVIDTDETVWDTLVDLKAVLATTDLDSATVTLGERLDPHYSEMNSWIAEHFTTDKVSRSPARRLYRCQPDLRVVSNHFTYIVGQGDSERVLWSANMRQDDEPTLDLEGKVILEHRRLRDKARADRAWDYYRARDAAQIEPPYNASESETHEQHDSKPHNPIHHDV